jgi:hypothetical protein
VKARTPKPISPEKMTALLLKLRKGADASVPLPQLMQVLAHIGGFTVLPAVGVVERTSGGQHSGDDEAEVRAEYDRIKAAAATDWPIEGVEVGITYYAEVEPVASWDRSGTRRYSFHYREGEGAEGIEVVAEVGARSRFLPNWYGSTPRIYPYEVLRWLKSETDYLVRVSAALGMEPHIPASQRTVENTGSCPCCFGNFKLEHHQVQGADMAIMVLHGYQRPRIGVVLGECFGRGRVPFELSADGTIAYRATVISRRDHSATYLASLRAGTITSLSDGRHDYTPKSPEWPARVARAIGRMEGEVQGLEAEIRLLSWFIDGWELRPLPKVGEQIRDWKMEAWTAMRKADKRA